MLAKPIPFVGVGETMGGRYVGSVRSERSGDLFKFFFAEKKGEVVLKVENFNGGFTFTVVDFTVPDSKALYVGRVAPVPKKWIGRRANMASDEKSGLCVRAYDLYSEMHSGGHLLQVRIPVERAVGSRFGIVGAPREKLQASLQAMTLASGGLTRQREARGRSEAKRRADRISMPTSRLRRSTTGSISASGADSMCCIFANAGIPAEAIIR